MSYSQPKKFKLTNSLRLLKESKRIIPGASQTLSKGYTQWSVGASPLFIERARGCEVIDVDGNTYIDFAMGLGPFLLGYNDVDINRAVRTQLTKGTMFTLPHPLEIEAAKLIIKYVPSAEMVRFGKNGSDSTTASIRLARAYTGKDLIIACGYHGWHDWYISSTERDAGIPKVMKSLIRTVPYNDLDALQRVVAENRGKIAGMILEPVYTIPPNAGYLEAVRALTKKEGIVLIFDEMFSGFRWSLGGAQQYFKVTPDLSCFGKAIGNGFPVSVITGRRNIMQKFEDVFFSFAYGGETLSLAAIIATIHKMKEENVHAYIWRIGELLKTGIGRLIEKHDTKDFMSIIGYPVKSAFNFSGTKSVSPLHMKTYFQQECAKRGVLFIGYHLPAYAHRVKHITRTLQVYDEVIGLFKKEMKQGTLIKHLEGTVVTQVFKNVGDRSSGVASKPQRK